MIGEAGFDEDNQSVGFSIRADLAFSQSIDERDEGGGNDHAAVSRLWQYCEDSQATVKLLLPDALHVPFYLPMQRRKQATIEEEMEREKRRLEAISMQSMSRISQRSAHIHMPDFGSKALDRRERLIEHSLMDKYRKNPEKAADIIKKYFATKKKKRIQEKEEVVRTPRRFSLHEGPLISLAPDKHTRASVRRSTLIAIEIDKLKDKEEQWIERVQSVEEKASKVTSNPAGQRQREWILLVKALNKLRYMYLIVKNTRDLRENDTVSWNAVLRIQHCYAKYKERMRKKNNISSPTQTPKMLKKMRSNLRKTNANSIYTSRVHACTVILALLREVSKSWKSVLLGYIRKVRLIQRRIRRHLAMNAFRVEMTCMLLERIHPVVFAHLQVIQGAKGYDLQNMQALDVSRLQEATRSLSGKYALVRALDCGESHLQLRQALNGLKLSVKCFGPAKMYNYDVYHIKKKVILSVLFRKRREFHSQIKTLQSLAFQVKKFNLNEVKAFMLGGEDPLAKHLRDVQNMQDQIHLDYIAQQQHKKRNSTVQNNGKYTCSQMLLPYLTTLKVEDLVFMYAQISEQTHQYVTSPRLRNNVNMRSTSRGKSAEDGGKDGAGAWVANEEGLQGNSPHLSGSMVDIDGERIPSRGNGEKENGGGVGSLMKVGRGVGGINRVANNKPPAGVRNDGGGIAMQDNKPAHPHPHPVRIHNGKAVPLTITKNTLAFRRQSRFRPPEELLSLQAEVGEYVRNKNRRASVTGGGESPRYHHEEVRHAEAVENDKNVEGGGRRKSSMFGGRKSALGALPLAIGKLLRIKHKIEAENQDEGESGLKGSLAKSPRPPGSSRPTKFYARPHGVSKIQ